MINNLKSIINELRQIVLYFWDLPQALEDKGGWLNPKTIDWFVEYARVCFTELGNNVRNC